MQLSLQEMLGTRLTGHAGLYVIVTKPGALSLWLWVQCAAVIALLSKHFIICNKQNFYIVMKQLNSDQYKK